LDGVICYNNPFYALAYQHVDLSPWPEVLLQYSISISARRHVDQQHWLCYRFGWAGVERWQRELDVILWCRLWTEACRPGRNPPGSRGNTGTPGSKGNNQEVRW